MRRVAAIAVAKTAGIASRWLRVGGGTALPGILAQGIDSNIVKEMAPRLGHGTAIITGTNGKTTTARLLRSICRSGGLRPVANRAGSNMMRGIAAALAESASLSGDFSAAHQRIGVFEVDEATLPEASRALSPRLVLLSNLFRDQLDRYGEVEHVAAIWRDALSEMDAKVTSVLNADDPSVAGIAQSAPGRVVFYGFGKGVTGLKQLEHAADARWCLSCGAELAYEAVTYGHLGHWRCPECKAARPAPDVSATSVVADSEGTRVVIATPDGGVSVRLAPTGMYNAYNALAAAAVAWALGIPSDAIERGIGSATAAFGRQERLVVGGRRVQVILAKNPAGLNEVLRTISADGREMQLAVFLNDDLADGRDVSWIWDVDFELLRNRVRSVTVSGRRAWDMALRLKYGGLEEETSVEEDTSAALRLALKGTPEDAILYVIPTYTAMLDVRELLARWARRPAFWEAA